MKLSGQAISRFFRAPPDDVDAVLLYGADRGLSRERAEALIEKFGVADDDPFAKTSLNEEDVSGDPARLGDEMRAMSLTGGARVIRIRVTGEAASAGIASVLAEIDAEELKPAAKLIVEAGELRPSSTLRKAFEGAKRAAAAPAYADNRRDLTVLADEVLGAAGLALSNEARAVLLPHLEGDRAMARQELEKLALYLADSDSGTVRAEDVEAVCAGAEPASLGEFAAAAASGDAATADRALRLAQGAGVAPVAACRALSNHLLRIADIRAKMDQRWPIDRAVASSGPPVFGPRRDELLRQVRQWNDERLGAALSATLACERALKAAGGGADQAVIGRAAFEVARQARASKR